MRLKLDALERVVKKAMNEEKGLDALREELKRVLGPTALTEARLEELAESANHMIDIMEQTGKINRLDFKPHIVTKYLDHGNVQVRKFAARVAPEKFLTRMTNDRSTAVRAVVASRAKLATVREMMKNFPTDDQLKTIYKKRVVVESGVAQPKPVKEPFDIHGDKRLGDSVKQSPGPELSEQWYKDKAFKLMQDFGGNIENSWEELAARAFARSTKATSGVEIDEVKLLKAIKDLIEEKEDRALERDALKETLDWLSSLEEKESLQESAMPVIEEANDVESLLSEDVGAEQFVEKSNAIFQVKHARLPVSVKKYNLDEGSSLNVEIPIVGMMPEGIDASLCEKALDEYCKRWSEKQALRGEPLKLDWSYSPTQVGKISFSAVLR